MGNAGLEEAQAGIKIAGRNINNLRYADDTTLVAPSSRGLPDPGIEPASPESPALAGGFFILMCHLGEAER